MAESRSLVVVTGVSDSIFPVESAKECVKEGKRVYDALGAAAKSCTLSEQKDTVSTPRCLTAH